MSGTIRLTAAQAMMRWLSVQTTEEGERFIEGVWAIFGHGNVAGIGEALHRIGDALADLARAERADHGARGDRLRQGEAAAAGAGGDLVDRAGRRPTW